MARDRDLEEVVHGPQAVEASLVGTPRQGREERAYVCHVGTYIQAWRHRLQPGDAGLPAGPSRRARGLRREELASLAAISVDYLVRLEQGRATNPSVMF